MATLKGFMAEGKSLGKSYEEVMQGVDIYKEKYGEFDSEEQAKTVPTNKQVREVLPDADLKTLDGSTNPEERISKISVTEYMNTQLPGQHTFPKDALEYGRRLYKDDNLNYGGLQALLSADEDIMGRHAKYIEDQYGMAPERIRSTYEEHDAETAERIFGTEVAYLGLAKAFADLGAGIGEWALPKSLEKKLTDPIREDVDWIDENQVRYMDSLLVDGDYDRFKRAATYKLVGDTAGQLVMISSVMKGVGKLGPATSLKLKEQTMGMMAKSSITRAAYIGAINFIQSDAPLEDKLRAFTLTQFYMNSPVISSQMGGNASAKIVDIMINSIFSSVYDPEKGFQMGGQYKEGIARAKKTADDLQSGHDYNVSIGKAERKDFDYEKAYSAALFSELVLIAGPDVSFGLLTTSVKSSQRQASRRGSNTYIEGARRIHNINSESFNKFKDDMTVKYGDNFLTKKMDPIDLIEYENRRQINVLLEKGVLPPALTEIAKTFDIRVNPAEMARKFDNEENVDDVGGIERSWRDADGKLVHSEEVAAVKDGKFETSERQADTPKPTAEGVEKEVSFEDALAGLEKAMASDKGTEVIKTDADIGTGVIPETMRLGVKESVELMKPDLKSKDAQPWIDKQITFISRLMEMGEIKTKKDYNDVLETYTQRSDVDANIIYKEAQKARKHVADTMKAAEEKSAKAKITQKQFKPEKQMVVVDSMNIIKDRIKAMQEGVKLGKKVEKGYEKARKAERQSIVDEAVRVVKALSTDKDIKNSWELKALKAVKTDKSLTSFISKLTDFIEKDTDAKERKALVADLNKDIGDSVNADYASAVMDLRDMINTDTTAKSAWRLENQRIALDRHKDIKLPADVLKKMQQTSVNDLSTDDLRTIVAEKDRLIHQGKAKRELEKAQFKREVADDVADIMRTSKQAPVNQNSWVKPKEKITFLQLGLGRGALRPWNIADLLDGGKATYDGTAHRVLINDANEAHGKSLESADARLRGGEMVIRSLDMKVKDLNKKVNIGGKDITLDQALSVYASSKNKLMHNAVLHGNMGGDRAAYEKIVSFVGSNEKYKALADYIVYDYANNYDRVRKAVVKNENKILGQEENYVPMIREDVDKSMTLKEIGKSILDRDAQTKTLPDGKFTINRVDVPENMQNPVKLGLFDQWEKSVGAQERYINMFGQVQKMNAVLNDKGLKKQVGDAYGESMNEVLKKYVEAYGNPMSLYKDGGVGSASRKFRKNIALAYLSYNTMTMLKQIPSLTLYLGQGGAKHMLSSIGDFNSSWRMVDGKPTNELIKWAESKDPQLKHAHVERELVELKNNDAAGYDKIISKISEPGMKGIIAFDKVVRTIGWTSVYRKSIEAGKSESQSITDSRNSTLRSQPAASAKDLPLIYKEISPMFTMFSNQLNQIYNIMGYQLPRAVGRGDIGAGVGMMAGLMANAYVFYLLQHGEAPTTPEEVKAMATEFAIGKVPVVGGPASAALQGYDAETPGVGLVTSLVDAAKQMEDQKPMEATQTALKATAEATAVYKGLPVVQSKRVMRAAKEGDMMKLFGVPEPKKKK